MDPKLRADLDQTLKEAECRIMVERAQMDADLLLLCDLSEATAALGHVLSKIMGISLEYTSAVMAAVVLKAKNATRALSGQPYANPSPALKEAEEGESEGHVLAHTYMRSLLESETQAETLKVSKGMQDSLTKLSPEEAGHFCLHLTSLASSLLLLVVQIHDERVEASFSKMEDEGDSRS